MIDVLTHEFLKDERTEVSCAHMLTGSAQWQGIVDEDAVGIDGERRGIDDRPVSRENEPFSQTAIGFVLGQTAMYLPVANKLTLQRRCLKRWAGSKRRWRYYFWGQCWQS